MKEELEKELIEILFNQPLKNWSFVNLKKLMIAGKVVGYASDGVFR